MGKCKQPSKPTFKQLTDEMKSMVGRPGSDYERKHGKEKHVDDCTQRLKDALQLAVDLEFSTIPPYLCALWSIKDELDPAAVSIREVVQEEMLHMALACNMLTGIGGVPQITSCPPTYPTKLAGCLHPDLEVELSGLDDDSLKVFMNIELPVRLFDLDPNEEWKHEIPFKNSPPPQNSKKAKTKEKAKKEEEENSNTIGAFYEALLQLIEVINPTFLPDNQITGPLAYANITDIAGVRWAIELISHQGEGSVKSPFEDDKNQDLAHFYRFEQVFMESKLQWCPLNERFYKGEDLLRPDSWPMAPTPTGGYTQEYVDSLRKADGSNEGLTDEEYATVSFNLLEFDKVYSKLLDLLQSTWSGGGQKTLIQAYETMFELEKYAKPLMQVEIPGMDGKTFGPCFRYVGGSNE